MKRRFVTLDVFTAQRFAGNPLAVVLDADGLDTARMQAVAREFNLSETVFVLPPEDRAHRAKLRIFTPAAELPFAGHPTVGTAVLLGRMEGAKAGTELVLGEGVGAVRCIFEPRGEAGHARFAVPRLPSRTEARIGEAAAVLGLASADVGAPGFTSEIWSAGNPFAFVPVAGLDALARSRPDLARWDSVFPRTLAIGAFLFCRTGERTFRARMYAPGFGVPEDPATGSAAAAFAGLLAARLRLANGEHRFTVGQGYEMGRPSEMEIVLAAKEGALSAAWIGGEAVVVSEGMIET